MTTSSPERRSVWFVHGALIGCLCLQRFGATFGDSVLFISLPIFGGLVAWMLATRQASVSSKPAALYSLVACVFLISAELADFFPDPRVQNSLTSLAVLLVLYALLTIRPSALFDRTKTLSIFLKYCRACAALGIAQYCLQFAGFKLFSFSIAFPFLRPVLVEHKYAFNPVLSYGSTIVRSNGFFLLEPSIFSQVLALAVVVDVFIMRRYLYLPLYVVAYLVSFSGTGLVSLVIAVLIFGVTSRRNLIRSVGLLVLTIACIAVAGIVAPSIFASFAERAGELHKPQSSGYLRYVAQVHSIAPFLGEARSLIGYGPGAMERSVYFIEGTGNPALKLFVDYGLMGLGMFAVYLCSVVLARGLSILPILCLVIFQLGGGYLLFPPFVVLMTLLCVWSDHCRPEYAQPSIIAR